MLPNKLRRDQEASDVHLEEQLKDKTVLAVVFCVEPIACDTIP